MTLIYFQIIRNEKSIQKAPVVVFDANLSVDCMATILEICGKYDVPGMFIRSLSHKLSLIF